MVSVFVLFFFLLSLSLGYCLYVLILHAGVSNVDVLCDTDCQDGCCFVLVGWFVFPAICSFV